MKDWLVKMHIWLLLLVTLVSNGTEDQVELKTSALLPNLVPFLSGFLFGVHSFFLCESNKYAASPVSSPISPTVPCRPAFISLP